MYSPMHWKFYPIDKFPSYQGSWQKLNLAGSALSLLSPTFIVPLLKTFGTRQEILAVYGEPNPLCMAILTSDKYGTWQTFQPSQAPLGCWIMAPSIALEPLLSSLMRALPGLKLIIGITQQDPDLWPRPAHTSHITTMDYIKTAKITVQGSFEDYWNNRGKNLRHNLKRQRNRLEKEGITLRLEVIRDPKDVANAIADYGRLESTGWKAGLGTAVHPGNAQGRYYQMLLEDFCQQGKGRIYRYWYNDKITAMDLCIEDEGTLVILKTTYDEAINTSSPAQLMRQESFAQLFEEGRIKTIEFYGRLMDWHTKWTDEIRILYHINYYRWHILQKLHQFRDACNNLAGKMREKRQ